MKVNAIRDNDLLRKENNQLQLDKEQNERHQQQVGTKLALLQKEVEADAAEDDAYGDDCLTDEEEVLSEASLD